MPAVTYTTRGLVLTEHEFSVPLDHTRPGGRLPSDLGPVREWLAFRDEVNATP